MKQFVDSPRKIAVIAAALLLIWMTWYALQPEPGSPEAVCKKAVEELVAAAEARNIKPFRKWLSEEVQDESNRDKQQILRVLKGIFLRYPNISLNILSLKVSQDTNPDLVHADLDLFMSDTALPQDRGKFNLTFRREGGTWRIWQLEWQEGANYGL
ncbi:MAG: nuclear transport factor 2 family protein [Acidobacteriota bacterium]|nr:nuclear transport factor 2 family protein [Acidobacteriota bacterium]